MLIFACVYFSARVHFFKAFYMCARFVVVVNVVVMVNVVTVVVCMCMCA